MLSLLLLALTVYYSSRRHICTVKVSSESAHVYILWCLCLQTNNVQLVWFGSRVSKSSWQPILSWKNLNIWSMSWRVWNFSTGR